MILNDYTQEYLSLNNYLNECDDFIITCKNLIQTYQEKVFAYTKGVSQDLCKPSN